jgi:hypothetical protein
MQKHASQFFTEVFEFVNQRNEGFIDPVFDKGLGVASGCVLGHQRCRPPYVGWEDKTVIELRTWLKTNHTEFLHPDIICS